MDKAIFKINKREKKMGKITNAMNEIHELDAMAEKKYKDSPGSSLNKTDYHCFLYYMCGLI